MSEIKFPIEITSNTLVDYPRLEKLVEFINETKDVSGHIAEVGVYKGGTACLLRLYCNSTKWLYLFDTFIGMPAVDSLKDLHKEGDFSDTSAQSVRKLIVQSGALDNFDIYAGVFPNDKAQHDLKGIEFSLVHLDCDIYKSVKESLEFFWPLMSPGGIIVLDDYNEPNCPGAKLAADEFAESVNLNVTPTVQSQAILRKC